MFLSKTIAVFIIVSVKLGNIECFTSSHLPNLLIPCYNGTYSSENKPPLTTKILVELLRKIELDEKTNFNLRILTTSLLHEIKFDGVLKSETNTRQNDALLYRARGREFHKYKLVTDYIVTGESTLSVNESLNQDEICFMHYMLSTTVENSYRGDEKITCGYIFSNTPVEIEMSNLKLSSCPLMKGNIRTKWGSITPGNLIFGLSAALENSETSFNTILGGMHKPYFRFGNDTADGIWISTIAGDLAEALLNRADTDLAIATSGFWNDNKLPMDYYLSNYTSDLTESTILGSIDGIVLGYNSKIWKNSLTTTRLSQIIDMFYSKRGIVFKTSIKSSNRKSLISDIIKKTNLTRQVIGAAKLLKEIAGYDHYLSDDEVEELATLVVDKFEDALDGVTARFDSVEFLDDIEMKSSLEVILIMDGSYDYATSRKIIYLLAEAIEVSIYGSKLGILNGETGEWMSNITGSIFGIFEGIGKFKTSWPKQLSLQKSFEGILHYLEMKMKNECRGGPYKPLGISIIILSNYARPESSDLDSYKKALSSIKDHFPDINILYALTPKCQEYFHDLPNRYLNDSFVNITDDIENISKTLAVMLQRIPGQIINFYCDKNKTKIEDYLTPGIDRFYEIHEEYNAKMKSELKFTGNTYGNITICFNSFGSNNKMTCKIITENEELVLKTAELCDEETRCNIQFVLNVTSSKFSCAENDCRYPDQVRLDISWLKSNSQLNGTKPVLLIIFCYIVCSFWFRVKH